MRAVLREILAHPGRYVIRHWNWKAALISIALRAPILFITSLKGGLNAALAAAGVETIFRAVTSGIFAAVIQELRFAQPVWLSAATVTFGIPALVQILQILVHWLAGTPNLFVGMLASVLAGAVTALFNWFVMRHDTLIVGEEGRSLWTDIRAMPELVARFVVVGPLILARAATALLSRR